MADGGFTVAPMTDEHRPGPLMSDERSASLTLDASDLPHPRGRGRQAVALILLALLGKLAMLAILGRPLNCDCGQIWAMPNQAGLNSRTLLDPYSLQHLVFGAVLVKLVRWKRPDWSLWTLMATVVVSSTIWEVAENTPFVIELFGYSPDDPMAYHGDSIVNSFSDTTVAVLGAALALPFAGWAVALLAFTAEVLLALWIQDSFLITAWRALGF